MDAWDRLLGMRTSRRGVVQALAAVPFLFDPRIRGLARMLCDDPLAVPATPSPLLQLPQMPQASQTVPAVPALNASLLECIAQLRDEGTIKQGEEVSFYAFDPLAQELLADIDADVPRRIASVGKVGVATAYLDAVNDGLLHFGPQSERHLYYSLTSFISRKGYEDPVTEMLADGNLSTTWMIDRLGSLDAPHDREAWTDLGLMRVQTALRKYQPVFQEIDIVGAYPFSGREYRNTGSARGCAQAFRALMYDDPRLQNLGLAADIPRLPRPELLRVNLQKAFSNRLVANASHVANSTRRVHKTGTTILTVADVGYVLFTDRDRRYRPLLLSALVEAPEAYNTLEDDERDAVNDDFVARGKRIIGSLSDRAALAHNERYDLREVKP